jgi:hypothetical protein
MSELPLNMILGQFRPFLHIPSRSILIIRFLKIPPNVLLYLSVSSDYILRDFAAKILHTPFVYMQIVSTQPAHRAFLYFTNIKTFGLYKLLSSLWRRTQDILETILFNKLRNNEHKSRLLTYPPRHTSHGPFFLLTQLPRYKDYFSLKLKVSVAGRRRERRGGRANESMLSTLILKYEYSWHE